MNYPELIHKSPFAIQERITRYDLDIPLWYARYPEETIETDPLPSFTAVQTYESLIQNFSPEYYFRLGEQSGTTATNIGTTAQNGTYTKDAGTTNFSVDGALASGVSAGTTDPNDQGKTFDVNRDFELNFSLSDFGTSGTDTDLTFGFWYKRGTHSIDSDYLFNIPNLISATINEATVTFFIGDNQGTISTGTFQIQYDAWNYIVVTVTDGVTVRCYVDGQRYGIGTLHSALKKPGSVTANFGGGGGQTPFFGVDELVIASVAWDSNSIALQYLNGQYAIGAGISQTGLLASATEGQIVLHWPPNVLASGFKIYRSLSPNSNFALIASITNNYYIDTDVIDGIVYYYYYTSTISGTDTTGSNIAQGVPGNYNPYLTPNLINEVDISSYISEWSVDRDDTTLVDSLMMTASQLWDQQVLDTYLQANTYITIEQRYTDVNRGTDTGWVSIGHFLLDGPTKIEENGQGQMTYTVSGRSSLKLTTLDIMNWPLTPDIIKIPKVEATQVNANEDRIIYQVIRSGPPNTTFYYNWAPQPTVKLWTLGPYSDTTLKTGDIYRIRGSGGSVQVVAGAGQVRIDTNFFNSTILNGGIGEPSHIYIELYRYATVEDVAVGTIVSGSTTITNGLPTTATLTVDVTSGVIINDPSTNYLTYIGRTFMIKSGNFAGRRYNITSMTQNMDDTYSLTLINVDNTVPDFTGEMIDSNSACQITDANLIEDVIEKILIRCGLQMIDSTKPLYFQIDPPQETVLIQPILYTYRDKQVWSDVLSNVLEEGPPNYKIFVDNTGIIRTTTVGQKDTPDTYIYEIIEDSTDHTDINIYTEVYAQGTADESANIALHQNNGGYAISGSYVTDDFHTGIQAGDNASVSQETADGIMSEVIDLSAITPNISNDNTTFGFILEKYNTTQNYFAGTDVMWIDIGVNASTGNEWQIDQFDFTCIPTYRTGNIIKQSFSIYVMTQGDFIANTGFIPPAVPQPIRYVDSNTYYTNTVESYMQTLKDSQAWKCLVDETAMDDGLNSVQYNNFINGLPSKFRFIKLVCEQSSYRIEDTQYQGIGRVVISDLKAWLSTNIVQSAKLGYDEQFNTTDDIDLAARLRPRRYVIDTNPYLDTTALAKNYAMNELVERVNEFSPYPITCIAPGVQLHQTVAIPQWKLGTLRNYFVKTIKTKHNGETNMVLIDYRTLNNVDPAAAGV